MSTASIGVAVIGAGMAGRAHANGYRSAPTVFGGGLPPVRLVAIADAYEPFAVDTAQRYGYERAETSWEAIAEAPDIDAVSVVVANTLHREIVEALLEAGKHVLCEKPLAPSVADGQAMADRAAKSDRVAAVGFTFRRSPAINAIREQVTTGTLGPPVHFNGHYWCDYGFDPEAPMSWRYRGGPGSGALADIGTHVGRRRRVPVRPGAERARRGAGHHDRGPARPAGRPRSATPAAYRSATSGRRSGTRTSRRSRPRSRAAPPARSRSPGSLTGCRTHLASRCSAGTARPRSTWPGRRNSRSPTTRPRARSTGTGRSCWARRTRTSPRGCRWTSPASATGRATSSPTRRGPSWTRSPGGTNCRAAPAWAKGCTTCASWTRSSRRRAADGRSVTVEKGQL